MDRHLLNRRQFSARCAAFGLSFPALSATLAAQAAAQVSTGAASKPAAGTVKLPDGTTVPPLGQGCWHLGQGRHPPAVEEEALRTGISLGMTLIDTSGNYGNGRSEQFISHVTAGQRDRVFLVSKVEPNQVSGDGITRACGVSNFNVGQMEDLFRVPDGHRCATNQVPYSLNYRHIEPAVLLWCKQHNMPVMAYSPLGGDHNLIVGDRTLAQVGTIHGCSAAAVALAWVIRSGSVIAIPESGSPAHVRENAAALSVALTPQDLQTLGAAFPGPFGATA